MGDTTNIAWCKSTFNPFIGCTKISPGCDSCYAEALDKRHKWGGATHWGAGIPRYRTSASNWKKPLQWNKEQQRIIDAGGGDIFPLEPWRVFCASLADVFDNEVPQEWRDDLWRLIEQTPHLSWLLVTKRIGNVAGMVPSLEWLRFHDNVRILITVCNQEEADRDIPKLLALPCKNGISYEPALGPVDFTRWLEPTGITCMDVCPDTRYVIESEVETFKSGNEVIPLCPECGIKASWTGYDNGIEWIIVGGESNQGQHKARPFDIGWARSTVQQCKAAEVPVFVKQMGSGGHETMESFKQEGTDGRLASLGEKRNVPQGWTLVHTTDGKSRYYKYLKLKDRAGADPSEWPDDLRVREFPR